MEKPKVLVIVGPTASGKTSLGAGLAKRLGGEVISCDSMQIYEGLDIATAKPTPDEMQGVPHHLISIIPRTQRFSVADYAALAREKICDITARRKLPVLVGGTGLYADAVLSGMQFEEETGDSAVREQLYKRLQTEGADALYRELRSLDPQAAEKIHPNNSVRLVRALEVCLRTGGTFTAYKQRNAAQPSPYDYLIFAPYWERDVLYDRIDRRVDIMLQSGLVEEVRSARSPAMQTSAAAIGYKELLPYLDGNADLESCVEQIKRESRRYAKRQLTWFRRNAQIHWLNMCESDEVRKNSKNQEKIIAKIGEMWYNKL
ncbi:MAG: tRNA (adenosine(37)-N6)-dimethylallyltransferase MiaA [Oscillospiraceae bacterium]|nr:tRNA (adenosine(37)-N6)-dimethylallyltransferase MiaA [Oscillospiraceae bacterium]